MAHREVADLDGVVGACDERDEETEHHVDEQADEGVQVELREEPDQAAAALLRLHGREGHEHVIPVDEREQAGILTFIYLANCMQPGQVAPYCNLVSSSMKIILLTTSLG